MRTSFIQSFHLNTKPEDKLKPEFCMEVVYGLVKGYAYDHLLQSKDISEIDEFSSGHIRMNRFKRMFKSIKKSMETGMKNVDGSPMESLIKNADKTGLSWEPLALIPQKLNSAHANIQKIPVEVTCVAQDGLAMKKKKEDIEFLKAKPLIEEDLQDIADQMQIGKVDIGTTKHSSKKYSEAPMGLDLTDPDEENIFSSLLYSLNVEAANEKALQQFYNIKKCSQVKGLEIMDQLKYGVSTNAAYPSSMTGLPDMEYIYPGDIETPASRLPDFSDNSIRIWNKFPTILEMFNLFGDEICDEAALEEIINGNKNSGGYCACNDGFPNRIDAKSWGTFKVHFKYIEVKSIDWVGVIDKKKSKRGTRMFTTDEKECTSKIWAQNTYGFWWLVNTKRCFGIKRLPFSYRTKGAESFQNFSTNIYKSQPKSAVELSIGENIKAQIADIKLEYALIMSLPAGKYIDLRFLRGALSGLKEENNQWTQQMLIDLAFEKNIFIGDTSDFDGKTDGQLKPFLDMPGGLKSEIAGYITTILNADRNISNFTGINEQLTGQSPNPDMLVGLQKLLINSGLNAIYYCNEAIQWQYTSLFNIWGSYLQAAIEKGGKTKEAIINMIGLDDTNLLDGLDETPLHNLTIKVLVGQREIERQKYELELDRLKKLGVLNAGDDYILSGIENTKERFAYMAVKEKKFQKKQDQIRQEQFAQQQQLVQKQGENMVQAVAAEGEQNIKEIYAKADAESKIIQLSNQLGLNAKQVEGLIKMALQRDRNAAQKDKGISAIREKANVQQQEALA